MATANFSNEVCTEPTLTTVDQRCEQIGRAAVPLLQKILPSPDHKVLTPCGSVIKPKLIVRDSSQREG